jgi:hypothetical protein
MKTEKLFDPEHLTQQQLTIDKMVQDIYEDPTFDGIVNIDQYCKAPIKILWIMKEVNDDGGYNQREALDRGVEMMENRGDWKNTLDPIIYVSYSILNNFQTWKEMDFIRDDNEMVNVLKQIAYINIKKEVGGAQSYNDILGDAYNKYKTVIIEQIVLANPDIIICGNTLSFLLDDLNLNKENLKSLNSIEYIIKDQRLIINAYHPNQRTINREDYCNDIINLAKDFIKK